jgi:hypothetical protein
MQRVSISLTDEHYKKVKADKEKHGIPLAETFRRALSAWYAPKDKKKDKGVK